MMKVTFGDVIDKHSNKIYNIYREKSCERSWRFQNRDDERKIE